MNLASEAERVARDRMRRFLGALRSRPATATVGDELSLEHRLWLDQTGRTYTKTRDGRTAHVWTIDALDRVHWTLGDREAESLAAHRIDPSWIVQRLSPEEANLEGMPAAYVGLVIREPERATGRPLNAMTCHELAELVEPSAEAIVDDTARVLASAFRVFVEPPMRPALLEAVADRWSWSCPGNNAAHVLEHLDRDAEARPKWGVLLGRGDSWPPHVLLQDVEVWARNALRRSDPSDTPDPERARAYLRLLEPDYRPDGLPHASYAAHVWAAGVREPIIIRQTDLAFLYYARREQRERLRASAVAADRFARELVRGLASTDPEYEAIRGEVVADALSHARAPNKTNDPDPANHPDATGELDRALRLHLRHVAEMLAELPPATSDDDLPIVDGRMLPDERFAAYLETELGEDGAAFAERVRAGSGKRIASFTRQTQLPELGGEQPGALWQLWADPEYAPIGCRFAYMLAECVWDAQVRGAIEQRQAKPPGLLAGVLADLARASTPRLEIGTDERGHAAIVRPNTHKPRHGKPEPVADVPVIDSDLLHRLPILGTRFALPAVEWLAETVQLSGAASFNFEGGWTQVTADVLGIDPDEVTGRDRQAMRAVMLMWAALPIRWQDGARSSSIVRIDESAAVAGKGRGRAVIRFDVADRLRCHEHHRARGRALRGETAERWPAWRIAPLVRPRIVPPLPGSSNNTYPAQTVYLRWLWLHIVQHGHELVSDGGVAIGRETMQQGATSVQLPERLAEPVVGHFVDVGALELVEPGRYAPGEASARKFIEEGWKRSGRAAERGRKASRRRGKR